MCATPASRQGALLAIQRGRHAEFTVTAARWLSAPSIVHLRTTGACESRLWIQEPFVVDGLPIGIAASRSVQRDCLPGIDIHFDRSLAWLSVYDQHGIVVGMGKILDRPVHPCRKVVLIGLLQRQIVAWSEVYSKPFAPTTVSCDVARAVS